MLRRLNRVIGDFPTKGPTILRKLKYVNHQYKYFPVTDIRNGGKFRGWMFEGVVAF